MSRNDPTNDNPIKDWLPPPCAYCGGKVPRHGPRIRDYFSGRNEYGPWYANPNAGQPNVSSSMGAIDPDGIFCTMRCAARYAVRAAKVTP